MNLLIIAIAFSFIQTLTANEQKGEEDRTVAVKESLTPESDSDDIAFIEPELAVKDALAESELVSSDSKRGEEFLVDEAPNVDDQSPLVAKSGVDIEKLDNADTKSNNADTKSASSEESVDHTLDERTDHAADPIDTNERNSENVESVQNTAADTVTISEERGSVLEEIDIESSGTSADLENPEPLSGRRMMQDEVLDTKARSGDVQELRSGVPSIPQPNIQREVTLKPPELPRLFPEPNMSFNRPVFQPFLPKRSILHHPSQDQSFGNQQTPQTPRFNVEDLTNHFLRLNSYPAKERFQGSLSNEQYTQPSLPANTNNFPLANNMYFKPTESPPAHLNSNTPVKPIFMQTFTPTFDLQNFNRYNSLYRPGINI